VQAEYSKALRAVVATAARAKQRSAAQRSAAQSGCTNFGIVEHIADRVDVLGGRLLAIHADDLTRSCRAEVAAHEASNAHIPREHNTHR
jgi:hypothetical protein